MANILELLKVTPAKAAEIQKQKAGASASTNNIQNAENTVVGSTANVSVQKSVNTNALLRGEDSPKLANNNLPKPGNVMEKIKDQLLDKMTLENR